MSLGWQQLWHQGAACAQGDRGQLVARSTPAPPRARVTCRGKRPRSRRGAGPCWLLEVCTREPGLPCSAQGYFLCFLCFFFLGALLGFPQCLGLLLQGWAPSLSEAELSEPDSEDCLALCFFLFFFSFFLFFEDSSALLIF